MIRAMKSMRFLVYKFIPDIEKCRQLAEGPGRHVEAVGQPATFTVYVVDRNWKESYIGCE